MPSYPWGSLLLYLLAEADEGWGMVAMVLIEMEKAAFAYDDQPVFKDIDLQVDEGDIFCLFGPNGCGKSTLIHCLLGIARLNSGTVRLCGKDINKMKREEIARVLAYTPQLHEKPFPFKVIDVVLMGRASHKGFFLRPRLPIWPWRRKPCGRCRPAD